MKVYANAKVNLTLDVVKKREDGYHEMDMLMVPLSLCDVLDVTLSEEDAIVCGEVAFPLDESNTIYKAIALLRERFSLKQHFHVKVEKNIPMQAGLAGGSADGAAMLKAIIALCNLSIEEEELLQIAKQIGADVPFCVVNKASRVQGIGEKVTPFTIRSAFSLLLVKPKEGVSTGKAFSLIDFTSCEHPDVDRAQKALEEGDYSIFCAAIGNTLETSAYQITPVIAMIKEELAQEGVDAVLMSGSGSTVFAISKDRQKLEQIAVKMKEKYAFSIVCDIV